jgi:hypothetical protein
VQATTKNHFFQQTWQKVVTFWNLINVEDEETEVVDQLRQAVADGQTIAMALYEVELKIVQLLNELQALKETQK